MYDGYINHGREAENLILSLGATANSAPGRDRGPTFPFEVAIQLAQIHALLDIAAAVRESRHKEW